MEREIIQEVDLSEFTTVELLFDHLLNQENLAQKSLAEQVLIMRDFADQEQMSFDLDAAIANYDAATQQDANLDSKVARLLDQPLSLIYDHGFGQDLRNAIQGFRKELLTEKPNLSEEAYQLAEFNAQFIEYLAMNETLQTYLEVRGFEGLGTEKGLFDCFIYTGLIALYTVQCAEGKLYACGLLAYYVDKYVDECTGGNEDPCENDPDPCCQVFCAAGYYCDNGQCVEDPYADPCADCLPHEQCLNNRCVGI
ncbi:MAG: hypothetical protein AAFU67_14495 [Bacteroidota bacterium]